ncbi:hypothetical protein MWU75_11585 [Ornithinimicrobium sp. F0845]|uniref:IclR family transcriptional regulator domain-containing protein n=1 Tax=Ornithinimicrobium sp. F0845 TaxID=2926412 RepID=UPI001FF4670B|nr:IclR family transcriptional regulator C-terminal domain-containing protein [Ornithinimicrobium sp. F0845]MCK0112782.1 hypothetical protein [Ornithinimicrobium sp. F0845]
MEELRRLTNETIHLAVAEPPSMLLVERLESTHPVRYVEALGGLSPMALTSTGRASLSTMPEDMIIEVLEKEPRCADPKQRDHIMRAVRQAATDGYATTSEWRDGVFATAAAITWNAAPVPPPALSISAPETRMTSEKRALHAQLVIEATQTIQSKF